MKISIFEQKNHIFFIGIGGISMSGLAKYCLNLGIKVSGSDIYESHITKELQELGVQFFNLHTKNHITTDIDLVVYTGAISKNNPELKQAKKLKIKTLERSEFLGLVSQNFENVISVSGTHGKTTTTALIGNILIKAGLNPTIHLGGEVSGEYNNFKIGGNKYFVTEACEFRKSLLHLKNTVSLITNIELDHMDYYKDFSDILHTFQNFANNTSGTLVVGSQSELQNEIKHKNKIIFNTKNGFIAKHLKLNKFGGYAFDIYLANKKIINVSLKIQGKYNVINALGAFAVAQSLGVDLQKIKEGLESFSGVARRNEYIGKVFNLPMFADYAHHPTEIKNSLENYKNLYKKVLVVFQPHTYSRTVALINEFSKCFEKAHKLVIYKTYPAREEYDPKGSETAMFSEVQLTLKKKTLCLNFQQLKLAIEQQANSCKAILILGAGNLYDYLHTIFDIEK